MKNREHSEIKTIIIICQSSVIGNDAQLNCFIIFFINYHSFEFNIQCSSILNIMYLMLMINDFSIGYD